MCLRFATTRVACSEKSAGWKCVGERTRKGNKGNKE